MKRCQSCKYFEKKPILFRSLSDSNGEGICKLKFDKILKHLNKKHGVDMAPVPAHITGKTFSRVYSHDECSLKKLKGLLK
jgi:hypothetical protein